MTQQKKGLWIAPALIIVSIIISVLVLPLYSKGQGPDQSLVQAQDQAPDQSLSEQMIKITAKKFEYTPSEVRIKKGVPVVLEFTSLDRVHGFTVPDLGGIRTTIEPGKVSRVRIVAPTVGTYEFHCDLFCGDGHEGMTGKIIVED